MEILLLIALILLNGLFAMSEIALVAARRGRLARLAEEGDRAAAVAIKLHDDPTRFLSSIQIGITSISILNGIVGQAVLAEPLALQLQKIGLPAETSNLLATALVVVVITYVSIVIGELVPKRIGQFNPEGIARRVARPIVLLARLTHPFVRLLSFSTDAVLQLLGTRKMQHPTVTEEEIHAMLEEGSEAGVIEQQEHTMVRNIFRLDERPIASLMTPRADIVYLDLNVPFAENLQRATESIHSRFPVCEGGLSEVRGIISAKEILKLTFKKDYLDLSTQLQPGVFVPESLSGMDLLEHFRASAAHMALVIDEYGDIQGLVTLHDVLEAVTGEMQPFNVEEASAVQREDGSWLLDGLIPIPELKDQLAMKSVPAEQEGQYHTLGGLMMWVLARLPKTGDVIEWQGWRLEVVDMDGNRIDKVLASRIHERAADETQKGQ
ncbi:MAG TPA: hemolysin family protein [Gammaproteobacteria bacterium]